jgi:hypothetical protein
MADFHQTSPPPQLPSLQRHDTSGGMSITAGDNANPPPPEKDDVHDPDPDALSHAYDHHAPAAAAPLPSHTQQAAANPETAKHVGDVLSSEVTSRNAVLPSTRVNIRHRLESSRS